MELIHTIVKQAVQEQDLTPVFMGTAYRNKGVQPLLDAVVRYLPSPLDRKVVGQEPRQRPTQKFPLEPDPDEAVRRHGVQDRRRSVRPVDVHAHLPGHDRQGRNATTTSAPARSSASAASCGCTPTSARKSTRAEAGDIVADHGHRLRQRRHLRLAAQILHAGKHVRARAGHQDGHQPR